MVKKYIKIYNKRNCLLALLCAGIVFVPLFAVSLFYDAVPTDILISFSPFGVGALCVGLASLCTIRFKKMIRQQERLYNVQFNDDGAVHLENTLYLSGDWLILAGTCAIYKGRIRSVSSKLVVGKGGSSNRITIKTVDHKKYRIWCLSSSNVRKIKKWHTAR